MSVVGEIFRQGLAEETFRDLLESAPDAMVVVDGQGRIALVNAQTERLFGYRREELLGKPVETLVPARFRSGHVGQRSTYAKDPHVRPMGVGLDLFGRRKDGSEFPVEIMLSPIKTHADQVVVSAIRDITERKEFERELQAKNVALEEAALAKDRFMASMSHELRTPLNAIIGFTGTLLMQLPGPLTPEQEEQLRIIQGSARHLLSLINDVLDLAKVQSGKVDVHFEPVNAHRVVDEITVSLRAAAEQKGLRLDLHLPPEPITMTTDQRALRQILANLVNNAIKYTERGSVCVELERVARDGHPCVEFRVVDTGIGIAPEDQRRIFDPFEQVDESTTRRFQGVGLGLYLSSHLASLLGGRITVESEPGRGSTFTLSLPDD
jgi:PAS domain S-box-containing protein